MKKIAVLFVCLGNICRSPLAHAVFVKMVANAGVQDRVTVDSAGTGDWHIGHEPDKRSQAVGKKSGYDLADLRARLVTVDDFDVFDIVLAMDDKNLEDLKNMQPDNYEGTLALFLNYATQHSLSEVPDPYYGGDEGFDKVLSLVEDACAGLLANVLSTLETCE